MPLQGLVLLAFVACVGGQNERNVDNIDYGGQSPNPFLDSVPTWTANTTHYVASYRPSENQQISDTTAMKVVPRRLITLNDVAQTFELDMDVTQTWKDPRLAWSILNASGTDLETVTIDLKPGKDSEADGTYTISPTPGNTDPDNRIWTPGIDASLNMLEPMQVLTQTVTLHQNGVIYSTQQVKATLSQKLDLSSYPFDSHDLVFTLMSSRYNNAELSLRLITDQLGDDSWSVTPWLEGWSITGTNHQIGYKTLLDQNGNSKDYDVYVLTISVTRDPEYYILNQVLPLMVIMAMASTTFIFELNGFEKRVTVLFTAILTLMAFSVYMGENLPRTGYSTGMHLTVYCCYSLLVLGVFHVSVVWLVLREHLARADEDTDGETTHQEMVKYLYTQTQLQEMHNNLKDAGLRHSSGTTDARLQNLKKYSRQKDADAADHEAALYENEAVATAHVSPNGEVSISMTPMTKPTTKGDGESDSDTHSLVPALSLAPAVERIFSCSATSAAPNSVEAPQGSPIPVDILDIDGDGHVTEEELALWKALDTDNDGSISLQEMLTHTQQLPLAEWTPNHVYIFLLSHDVAPEIASKALRQDIHGGILTMMEDAAFMEMGMDSPIKITQLKFHIQNARKITHEMMVRKIENSSLTANVCICWRSITESTAFMATLVHLDYHLRWAFLTMWFLCIAIIFPCMSDTTYAATNLGVVWYTLAQCGDWCNAESN
eukprot:TRINITY_DN3423_c0_g5_i1.p1 TRINITY_DN3423_c0_g5~~TRINITY_DN3423_c0_g5_i1.p1  ORF type:complete len:718 (+),score=113.23 TRINITY_DN3423_c0_g5_i1:59-2212(+)